MREYARAAIIWLCVVVCVCACVCVSEFKNKKMIRIVRVQIYIYIFFFSCLLFCLSYVIKTANIPLFDNKFDDSKIKFVKNVYHSIEGYILYVVPNLATLKILF